MNFMQTVFRYGHSFGRHLASDFSSYESAFDLYQENIPAFMQSASKTVIEHHSKELHESHYQIRTQFDSGLGNQF